MTLVINAESKKHYDNVVLFAKRIGLYEPIVPDPEVDQNWYEQRSPWRQLVVGHVDLGSSIAEFRAAKDYENLQPEPCFLTFEEVKKHFRPENYAPGNLSRYLKNALNYLDSYAEGEGDERVRGRTSCFLFPDGKVHELDHPDFNPSFYFRMFSRRTVEQQQDARAAGKDDSALVYWFNGGCLFYRRGDSGVGGPNFSVRLDSSCDGWSINT